MLFLKIKQNLIPKNSIIGKSLTQIELGKSENEKVIENQLKGAPSIKDLEIAEN